MKKLLISILVLPPLFVIRQTTSAKGIMAGPNYTYQNYDTLDLQINIYLPNYS